MANFKILGVNHVALAPKNAQTLRDFLGGILALEDLGEETIAEQKVLTHMFASDASDQATRLEILDGEGFDDGPVQRFLQKKGGGVHHVALSVDDVEAAAKDLLSRGVKLINETPRTGAHNTKIIFIHPHATGGVLIELVQQL